MARLDYLELCVGDIEKSKAFYDAALGLKFTDFGPDYAATISGDTDIGLAIVEKPLPPMGVINVENLEKAYADVKAAGGMIVLETITFPGGRRFEFCDPSGNRIGVWEKA